DDASQPLVALGVLALGAPGSRLVVLLVRDVVGCVLLPDDAARVVVRVGVGAAMAELARPGVVSVAQVGWNRPDQAGPDVTHRRTDGLHDAVRLRRQRQ